MFDEEVKELIDAFDGKYVLLGYNVNDYLKEGFCIDLKATFSQRLTQKEIKFGSAKAFINGQNIRVKGFLNDITWILQTISR